MVVQKFRGSRNLASWIKRLNGLSSQATLTNKNATEGKKSLELAEKRW